MANNLALTLTVSAAAGAATAVVGNLRTSIRQTAEVMRALNQRQRELGRTSLGRLTLEYQRQARILERLRLQQEALGRTEARLAAARSARGELRGQMMGMAAAGYLASQPLRVGIEFEASMSKVQALTRLDKDSEEMKALTEQARKLGAETSFTASEAAQAQGFLAMAGFKSQAILESMPAMLDLARAGDIGLQRTADIASNIQTAYGISSTEMPRVADVLTAAFTNSNVDLEMLSQTMKYMGPVAKQFGMSLEESAAMAGLLGNAGIQADMAGTALRGIMSKLAGPTSKQAKILKKLGITTADAAGNMRPLPMIIGDLAKATGKMGSKQKVATIMGLFDQRAGPAMLALMDQQDKIQAAIDTTQNSEGAAAATHKTMADNMEGDLITLKSAWEDLSISITDTQNGALRDLLQEVTKTVRGLSTWVTENKELVGTIIKWAGVLFMARTGLLVLKYGVSLLSSGILNLIGAFQRVRTAILIFQAAGAKAALFSLVTPIGLVIAAIIALGVAAYYIYKNWEPIKAWFAGLWDGIVSAATGIWTRIKTAFDGGLLGIAALILDWNPISLFIKAFTAVSSWFIDLLPEKFAEYGRNIMEGLGRGIDSAKEWIFSKIKAVADMLPDCVRTALGIASPSKVFARLGGFTMQGLAQGLQTAASMPLDAIGKIASSVAAAGSISLGAASSAMAAPAAPATAAGATAAAITINVYPSPGMDEKALADLVARKIADAQRASGTNRRARLSDAD